MMQLVDRTTASIIIVSFVVFEVRNAMRTTITIDDALLSQAQNLTGLKDLRTLLKEALRALIERESARRLILLGGTEPQLKDTPRRREDGL
jgi:Arc/MetJ family transcription regulator